MNLSFCPEKARKKYITNREYTYLLRTWTIEHADETHDLYTLLSDAEETRIFAFSPPDRTLLKNEFFERSAISDVITARKLDEGIMVHFFWNAERNEWNISTRRSVGGDFSPKDPIFPCDETPEYITDIASNPKTIREMVLDAMAEFVYQESEVYNLPDDLCDVFHLDFLDKECTYSCLLRHAENHIVYSVSPNHPRLICKAIRRFSVNPETKETHIIELDAQDPVWECAHRVFSRQPKEYDSRVFSLEEDWESSFSMETIYPVAWALTNHTTGEKTEIPNLRYTEAFEARYMPDNLRFTFLHLSKERRMEEYIRQFPMYSTLFSIFSAELETLIHRIHSAYVQYYIRKQRAPIPKKYFVQSAKLHHEIYLETNTRITEEVVRDYLLKMSTGELFQLMMRKSLASKMTPHINPAVIPEGVIP